MIVLFCGDRNWSNRELIAKVMRDVVDYAGMDTVIIHGAARGADTIAGEEAKRLGLEVIEFPADWKKHGKAAGMIRNIQMLDEKPAVVFAFHPDITQSKGTRHTVSEARRRGIQVVLYPLGQE